MYSIKGLHLELTDRCQAACPMCARNHNGGFERKHVTNSEISLEDFKLWFPIEFLSSIEYLYSSGNYGDPAIAKDCLEIYEYVRQCCPSMHLAIHTNGSLRDPAWFKRLGQVIGSSGRVIFAIDGFKGKHELYRRNTDFDKIIDNLKSVVATGCDVKVDSLIFYHNQDEVDELELFLKKMGVSEVQFKSTTRFYDLDSFPVFNKQGLVEYELKPVNLSKYKVQNKFELKKCLDQTYRDAVRETIVIEPKCVASKEIYVDCRGNVFPCSYLGSDYVETRVEESSTINILRNISVKDTHQHLKKLGIENLKDKNIGQIKFWNDLSSLWENPNKCLTCVNICGKH